MAELFANDVVTTLASSATSGATSLSIASSTGIPVVNTGDWIRARIQPTPSTPSPFELVQVTARSGTTLTVARGQEGTTAQAWSSGASVSFVLTAATINSLASVAELEGDDHAIGGLWSFTQTPTISGVNTATTGDVLAVQGLTIGLCVEVSGTYPARPSNFGMVQFRGVDNPNTLGLMLEGDDWVDLS